jgi:hypothetical protein
VKRKRKNTIITKYGYNTRRRRHEHDEDFQINARESALDPTRTRQAGQAYVETKLKQEFFSTLRLTRVQTRPVIGREPLEGADRGGVWATPSSRPVAVQSCAHVHGNSPIGVWAKPKFDIKGTIYIHGCVSAGLQFGSDIGHQTRVFSCRR